MKNADVKINGHYLAKVTNKVVTVKITSKHKDGGWHALNTVTGKKVHIKSADRLQESKKKAVKKTQPKPAEKAKPAKQTKVSKKADPADKTPEPKKKVSLVNAAIQILQKAKEPMGCKEIVEQVLEQKLWQPSKGGKTPANTLYSTFLREIKNKGKDARFKKAAPGKFELNK